MSGIISIKAASINGSNVTLPADKAAFRDTLLLGQSQAVQFGAINIVKTGNGYAIEGGVQDPNSTAFSTHLVAINQTGLGIDGSGLAGSGDASGSVGVDVYCDNIIARFANGQSDIFWVFKADGDLWFNGATAFKTKLRAVTPTADHVVLLPNTAGTLPIVPEYADLTDANAALDSEDFFWDTTLKKLRQTTA